MIHTLAITHDSQIMSMAHALDTLLRDMNNFIKQGRFAEAKNHCLMQLPNPSRKIYGVIDVYGNEFDSFLICALETNFESICSEAACPRKSTPCIMCVQYRGGIS